MFCFGQYFTLPVASTASSILMHLKHGSVIISCHIIRKIELKNQLGLDLSFVKSFGPRAENGNVVEGTNEIRPGRDFHLNDEFLLRYITGRNFNM